MVDKVSTFGRSAVDYVQATQIYKTFGRWGVQVQHGVTKALDFALPRNPVTLHREFRFIPTWAENALGATYYNDVCPRSKILNDGPTTERVKQVFNKLVTKCVRNKELNFEVRVMQDDKTVNAFCLPGGKIVITTGMLKKLQEETPVKTDVQAENGQFEELNAEDKLAAVLGHEIAHACAGHGRRALQLKLISFLAIKALAFTAGLFIQNRAEQSLKKELEGPGAKELPAQEKAKRLREAQALGSTVQSGVETLGGIVKYFSLQKHSRCNELEADKYGIRIAADAGYAPEASIWLQHKFLEMSGNRRNKNDGWFMRLFRTSIDMVSSHPPSEERLAANRATVAQLRQE